MANLEALWVAGRSRRGNEFVGSEQAHYTHHRISAVLKLEYGSVAADARGRMRLDALEDELRKGDVGTVVVTLGTTGIGAVDPLPEILALRERYGFRVHVDAAYGGYFKLIEDRAGRAGAAGVCGDRAGGFDCDRPAQAWAAAVWVRVRAVPGPGGGAVLQARFAVYVLHFKGVASGRDQPGVLARRGGGGGFVGDTEAVAAEAGRRVCPGTGSRAGRAAVELDRRLRADGRFEALAAGSPGTGHRGLEDEGDDGGAGFGAGTIDFFSLCRDAICTWR